MTLEAPTFPQTRVKAGTFDYVMAGRPIHADFIVHTSIDTSTALYERDLERAQRENDLNTQYEQIVTTLEAQGASDIQYHASKPSPFF